MGIGRTLRALGGMVDAGVVGSYAVAGAFASFAYIQPSHADRLDVLLPVGPGDVPAAIASWLAGRGMHDARDGDPVIGGWPVRFLTAADGLAGEALDAAVPIDVDMGDGTAPFTARVLTAEHLAATTLATGRYVDRARLVQLLEEGLVDMDLVDGIMRRHGLEELWRTFLAAYGPGPRTVMDAASGYPDILVRKALGRLEQGRRPYGWKVAKVEWLRDGMAGMAAAREAWKAGRSAGDGGRNPAL